MQYAERFNKRIVNQSKDEVSRVLDRSKLVIFLRHRFLLSLPFLSSSNFHLSHPRVRDRRMEAGIRTLIPMMEDGFRKARGVSPLSVSLERGKT